MLVEFNVLVYNIMVPVLPPIRKYGQFERAARAQDIVQQCMDKANVDVVVINEAIPAAIDEIVNDSLKQLGFVHRTEFLKDFMVERGGIVIFSKHLITQQSSTFFGSSCSGSDCLATKGVAYARVRKGEDYFNVFATHLQAWPGIKTNYVRTEQVQHTLRFIESMNIPKSSRAR